MSENVDFISNPKKAFWQFTTPLLLLTLFEAAYSFVDVFWVSQMNPESFFAIWGVSSSSDTDYKFWKVHWNRNQFYNVKRAGRKRFDGYV